MDFFLILFSFYVGVVKGIIWFFKRKSRWIFNEFNLKQTYKTQKNTCLFEVAKRELSLLFLIKTRLPTFKPEE